MKIALAMMVKDFTTAEPLLAFLKNARAYGHTIDLVLLGWQNSCTYEALKPLENQCQIKTLHLRNPQYLREQLTGLGLTLKHQAALLPSGDVEAGGPMPYGMSRNQLLMSAMLEGADLLFYIDDDVLPSRLKIDGSLETVDFFGGHLHYLKDANTLATTSDYTGYDIVPKLPIAPWQDYLMALGKPPLMGIKHCAEAPAHTAAKPTNKLLGGNLALKLSGVKALGGFYSTRLAFENQVYLGRGEDTLLGLAIEKCHMGQAVDIDLRIFHNAFKDYPKEPNLLTDPGVKDRFFYASMGWIARNPLLEVLQNQRVDWEMRHRYMQETAPLMAAALEDKRYLMLPSAMMAAHKQLDREIRGLDAFTEAWQAFGRCLT